MTRLLREDRTRNVVVTAIAAAAAAQIILALYRSTLEDSNPAVGVGGGLVLLLPLLRYIRRPWSRAMCRGLGFSSLVLGFVLAYAALASPVMGLVQRIALPVFAFSFGALLILELEAWRTRLVAVMLFVLAFVGGQLVMNHEAEHVRALRAKGVIHHWH